MANIPSWLTIFQIPPVVDHNLQTCHEMDVDTKRFFRPHVFKSLLDFFKTTYEEILSREILLPYCMLDKFSPFFRARKTSLINLYDIPHTTHTEGSHAWCLHFFKYMCKGHGLELKRKSPDHFILVNDLNERLKAEGHKSILDVIR